MALKTLLVTGSMSDTEMFHQLRRSDSFRFADHP